MNDLNAKDIVRAHNGWLKSHGLGNDYIVFNSNKIDFALDEDSIRRICNRNYGIGSDGILILVDSDKADFGLKIYNPDGSEAEKSGNGIRISTDYFFSMEFTETTRFNVEVGNLITECEIFLRNDTSIESIAVDMGKATFIPEEIPVKSEKEESLDILSKFFHGIAPA